MNSSSENYQTLILTSPCHDNRLLDLLGHKGDPYLIDIESRLFINLLSLISPRLNSNIPGSVFCVATLGEEYIANVFVGYNREFPINFIAILGHVFTKEEFRRKGKSCSDTFQSNIRRERKKLLIVLELV